MKFNSVIKKALGIAALAGAMVLGTAVKSEAAFVGWVCANEFCAGGSQVQVTDNGAGDTVANAGIISFTAASIGGITVTINTSQSKPLLLSGMDLSFVATLAAIPGGPTSGTVYLYATDTDFLGLNTGYTGRIGGTLDSGYVEAVICGLTTNVTSTTPSNCAYSGQLTGAPFGATFAGPGVSTVSPYALTIGVKIFLSQPGTTTGNLRVIPEPTTMALFGIGLIGLGYAARRRRR